MECRVDEYKAIVPVYAARVLSMEQLLEQSNPKLSQGEPPPASPLHDLAVSLPARAPKAPGVWPRSSSAFRLVPRLSCSSRTMLHSSAKDWDPFWE